MNKNRIKWLIAVAQALVLAATPPVFAATGKVYVADEGANSISIIDAASFKKIGSVAVGQGPHNVQASPDGKLVWVTNNGESGGMQGPMSPAKMPKSQHGGMGGPGAVWAIDTATATVVAKVPVGRHPAHVVLARDGRTAYITNGGDNTVSVVDTDTRRVIQTIDVGTSPHGLRISPDGKQAWVANLKSGNVSVIDIESAKLVAQIDVGKGPAQVGFTPDGRFGFVSLSEESAVAVVDVASRKLMRKIVVGPVPIQLFATPDSRLVLVANQGTKKQPGKTVSVIDVADLKVASTIKTGAGTHGVVVDPEGRHAFVTNTYANTVSVIDISSRKVVATVPVGREPNGITFAP